MNKSKYKNEIISIINYICKHKNIYTKFSGSNIKYTCFMGIGKIFQDELEVWLMSGYKIDFLCDNDPEKWGKIFYGYRCLSATELAAYGDEVAVIITVSQYDNILAQLKDLGLRNVHPSNEWMRDACAHFRDLDWLPAAQATMVATVEHLADDLSVQTYLGTLRNKFAIDRQQIDYASYAVQDDEYFVDALFPLSKEEYFVDAGAYTGDTLARLLDRTRGGLGHAYLFELNPGNFSKVEAFISNLPAALRERITAFNVGLWNERSEVHYAGVGDGFTITREDLKTAKLAKVDALDHMLGERRVSFIKMDIEGAEQPALAGAKGIIKTQKPKLAICTYHNLDDMLNIPMAIAKLCPEYKLYLRHHSHNRYGTVCYATV